MSDEAEVAELRIAINEKIVSISNTLLEIQHLMVRLGDIAYAQPEPRNPSNEGSDSD